jgi:hypothetical protein
MLSHCSINAENLKPASANMKSYDLSNVFNALKLVHKSSLLTAHSGQKEYEGQKLDKILKSLIADKILA